MTDSRSSTEVSLSLAASRRARLLGAWAILTAAQAVRVLVAGIGLSVAVPRSPVETHVVDIDRAALAELMLLPGIGPERAEQIVLERVRHGPFGGIDGLRRVRGIGPTTIERLRALGAVANQR